MAPAANGDARRALIERYHAAAHGVQSAVAFEIAGALSPAHEPKHLRVGVNTGKVEQAALVKLLIRKGLITELEYLDAVAEAMEEELARYEARYHVRFR